MKQKYCNKCEDYTDHEFIPRVQGDIELKFGIWKCDACENEEEENEDDE